MSNTSFPRHPHQSLTLIDDSKNGVFSFCRPTVAAFTHNAEDSLFVWKSRDQRKARHHSTSPATGKSRIPASPSLLSKLGRLFVIEYWNISWWVAASFTVGSVVWVINGFYAFLPFVTSVQVNINALGWSAWVGATIFEFGSLLLIWEAWNRGETAYFGWGLQRAFGGHYKSHIENGIQRIDETEEIAAEKQAASNADNQTPLVVEYHKPKHWIWFTSDTKYWRELGFLAGVIQLCAATIFWIAGWTGLPAIQNIIAEKTRLQNGVFWTPQVIGGTGFIISSALYMLETQKKWYKPEPLELGWHVGFWNLIGGIGFTLCGAFGYSPMHWSLYESSLSTFWGGWAFLIGSGIQLYEAVNPVLT